MIARGDLGVEMDAAQVPIIQKDLIRRCRNRQTGHRRDADAQSMIEQASPTRAEASDVANAIFDGTDAVMLSAETASGKYPREAVIMMGKIVLETEEEMRSTPEAFLRRREHSKLSISETICESIAHAAQDLDMRAIAVFTETGNSARLISKYRPQCAIYAFAPGPVICNRMNLLWGVHPVMSSDAWNTEEMVLHAEKALIGAKLALPGDVIGMVAGTRTHSTGTTNFMRLHLVGAEDAADGGVNARRIFRERRRPQNLTGHVPERRRSR